MTRSAWRITLDPDGTPIVLLDIGDRLDGELTWSGRRAYQIAERVRAASPAFFDRANRHTEIAFSRFVPESTDADNRAALLASLITIPALAPAALKIEVEGITDRYWLATSAIVTDYTPAKYITAKVPRRLASITILAAGLAVVSTTYTAEDIVISGTLTPAIGGATVRRVDSGDPITHAASVWSTDGTDTVPESGQWILISAGTPLETWKITVWQDGVNIASWTSYSEENPVLATWGYATTGTATGVPSLSFYSP